MTKLPMVFSGCLLVLASQPVFSGCVENEVDKLTTQHFEQVGEGLRTRGCKHGNWKFQCTKIPRDQTTLIYNAPPGYWISWYQHQPILLEHNHYPGGHYGIKEGRQEDGGPLTRLSLTYWCESEHKLWGGGNWRRYKIVGNIKREATDTDYQTAKRTCSNQ